MHQRIMTPYEHMLVDLNEICARHRVRIDDVRSQSRSTKFQPARREVCAYLREVRGWSYTRIGRFVGGRDHSTIIHAVRRPKELTQ